MFLPYSLRNPIFLEPRIQRLKLVSNLNKPGKNPVNNALSWDCFQKWGAQPCRHFGISTKVNKNPRVRAPMRTRSFVRLSLSLCVVSRDVYFEAIKSWAAHFPLWTTNKQRQLHNAWRPRVFLCRARAAAACVFIRPVPARGAHPCLVCLLQAACSLYFVAISLFSKQCQPHILFGFNYIILWSTARCNSTPRLPWAIASCLAWYTNFQCPEHNNALES